MAAYVLASLATLELTGPGDLASLNYHRREKWQDPYAQFLWFIDDHYITVQSAADTVEELDVEKLFASISGHYRQEYGSVPFTINELKTAIARKHIELELVARVINNLEENSDATTTI